ncbi:c-type cytochrome domain-containing protein [Flagellimonas myxillae]|uniref:c-type cytochrome domain-containing protein n=1 Tax=Flagellimonas myxillae TaxID=2942214 RepID=UPI00201EA5E9|nr:c-type cytochrome domain-containing protein [Muricauda myxillae]MCL6265044.1 hypothetical protein [Muricauda myxillae]
MEVLTQLLGRLHPVVVHLPIGFIIAGLLLHWTDRKQQQLGKVIPVLFYWGGLSGALACVSGYFQYLGEGYLYDTIKWHLWMGIATTLFCFLMMYRFKEASFLKPINKIPPTALTVLFFVLISITGHLGGNITHGKNFLTEPLPNSVKNFLGLPTYEKKQIVLHEEDWQDAQLYDEVIQPILTNSCVSCHSDKKMKGELQLHTIEGILKGGESGLVLEASNADESDLFVRMNLPRDHEDHMPPKDKSQPSKAEVELIKQWINVGHPFDQTIGESGLDKDYFLAFFPKKIEVNYPDVQVSQAHPDSIQAIKQFGIHVEPISKVTPYLRVSCINQPNFTDSDFKVLSAISAQTAILDLGGTQVSDSIFGRLGQLPQLTVLALDHTQITGEGIDQLQSLQHLKSINLSHSNFEESHLSALSELKSLQKLYLYQTNVQQNNDGTFQEKGIQVDYGNYEVPFLPTDSIVY